VGAEPGDPAGPASRGQAYRAVRGACPGVATVWADAYQNRAIAGPMSCGESLSLESQSSISDLGVA